MAIKRLQLTDSQHEGWEAHLDRRAIAGSKEKRFLQACLLELGGRLNEPWQFDETNETFWINIPDEPAADAATTRTHNQGLAEG